MIEFLIIQDFKENRRKCTAVPLADLPGFEFSRTARPQPGERPIQVPGGIWLDVDAPVLSRRDSGRLGAGDRVIVLDASWARVSPLAGRLVAGPGATLERRSLPSDLATAYPRRSKIGRDPERGLATVEAVFAVTVVLGAPRPEVLDAYRWAGAFLDRNRSVWERYGFASPPGSP